MAAITKLFTSIAGDHTSPMTAATQAHIARYPYEGDGSEALAALGARPDLTETVAEILATAPNASVRAAVAANPAVAERFRVQLGDDNSIKVACAVAATTTTATPVIAIVERTLDAVTFLRSREDSGTTGLPSAVLRPLSDAATNPALAQDVRQRLAEALTGAANDRYAADQLLGDDLWRALEQTYRLLDVDRAIATTYLVEDPTVASTMATWFVTEDDAFWTWVIDRAVVAPQTAGGPEATFPQTAAWRAAELQWLMPPVHRQRVAELLVGNVRDPKELLEPLLSSTYALEGAATFADALAVLADTGLVEHTARTTDLTADEALAVISRDDVTDDVAGRVALAAMPMNLAAAHAARPTPVFRSVLCQWLTGRRAHPLIGPADNLGFLSLCNHQILDAEPATDADVAWLQTQAGLLAPELVAAIPAQAAFRYRDAGTTIDAVLGRLIASRLKSDAHWELFASFAPTFPGTVGDLFDTIDRAQHAP